MTVKYRLVSLRQHPSIHSRHCQHVDALCSKAGVRRLILLTPSRLTRDDRDQHIVIKVNEETEVFPATAIPAEAALCSYLSRS